jgi:uncharacterized membrane protein YgcG
MAKQAVSPIERHAEKGVLGIAAILLFAAIGAYLVRSPNTTNIGGQVTTPGEVNERVRDAAENLRSRIASKDAEEHEVPNRLPELQAGASPLTFAELSPTWQAAVPMLPRVPNIGHIVIEGERTLAPVLPPSKPKLTVGRSMLVLLPPQTMGEAQEDFADEEQYFQESVNWVTVAATFDRREQERQCQLAGYKAGRRRAYLVGAEVQRRRQSPDGTWPEEWANVYTYAPLLPPAPPPVELENLNGQLVPTTETRRVMSEYFDFIKSEQLDIIRPLFPDVVAGNDWQYPEFANIDMAKLDAEFGWEEQRIDLPEEEAAEEETPKTPRELEQEQLQEIGQLLQQGQNEKDLEKLDLALELAEALQTSATIGTNKRHAEDMVRQIEAAISDVTRYLRDHPPGEEDEEEDDETKPISPIQVVWLHDCARGSVESGATYQYRMRVLLYNRYAAAPAELKDPADAQKVFLVGPWSEASDPVAIPYDTRVFLVSGSRSRDGVRVDIFKWFEGFWVKERFNVEVGERLGKEARVKLPDELPKVDFNTGNVVVDIDYDRGIRQVGRTGRDGSFEIDPLEDTVALVYMDSDGNLHERLLDIDRTAPAYKELKELVWREKRVVKKKERPSGGRGGGGGGGGRGGGRGGGGGGGPGGGGGAGGGAGG